MTRDGALAFVLLILVALYYAAAGVMPASDLSDAVGPAGLPKAYAVVLAVLSLVLLAGSRRADPGAPLVAVHVLRRVAGLLAIGVAYVVLVPWAGYPLAIAGLIIGTSFYQGGRLDGRMVAVGVLGAAVLWLVFVQVLGVAQPTGAWIERLLGTA